MWSSTCVETIYLVVILVAALALGACKPQPTPTPLPTATPIPTATVTVIPSPTSIPTASEPAPEHTFTEVGNVADLKGSHDITGRATVAGLQTLIIMGFNFDGKGPQADIRLVKGQDYANAALIITKLEQRPYQNGFFHAIIPSTVTSQTADSIIVYCPETNEAYASAQFK